MPPMMPAMMMQGGGQIGMPGMLGVANQPMPGGGWYQPQQGMMGGWHQPFTPPPPPGPPPPGAPPPPPGGGGGGMGQASEQRPQSAKRMKRW